MAEEIPHTIKDVIAGRIHVLIVEDEQSLRTMLVDVFSTPCTSVSTAATIVEAENVIARHSGAWHCWIVDLCLGQKKDAGMALIEKHGNFPFAIVYSGMGSMESASHATQLGAQAVIDKGFGSTGKLLTEVCGMAPVAVLCKGTAVKSKDVLFLLKSRCIREPREWADAAGITLRQLQNIATIQTGLPPSQAIPFYYGLRRVLCACLGAGMPPLENCDEAFLRDCVHFLEQNLHLFKKFF
jgi:hypothetical protein